MIEKPSQCPKCKSEQVIKWSRRPYKFRVIQRYRCKSCNYTFILNPRNNHLPFTDEQKLFVEEQIKKGTSYRLLCNILKETFGIKITYTTIRRRMLEE